MRFLTYTKPILMSNSSNLNNDRPILIIGANGKLGNAIADTCEERGISFVGYGHVALDITDGFQINQAIEKHNPWAIINAAGYVDVDVAEYDFQNCFDTNTLGSVNLATVCEKKGIRLLCYSSALVFDGARTTPYTEADEPNPVNTYGRSKLIAEEKVQQLNPSALIIRSGGFFGPWEHNTFANQVIDCVRNDRPIRLNSEAVFSPTYLPDLIYTSLDLLEKKEQGIWHISNGEGVTPKEFALMISNHYQPDYNPTFIEVDKSDKAPRPDYSVIVSERGIRLPSLNDAVDRFVESMEVVSSSKV